MDSRPPASAISTSPARIWSAAEHDRLQARAAHLVERGRRRADRHAGAERGLARGRLAEAGRQHAAEDVFLDSAGLMPAASMAAFAAAAPSCGAVTGANTPWNAPMGVRRAETMTTL